MGSSPSVPPSLLPSLQEPISTRCSAGRQTHRWPQQTRAPQGARASDLPPPQGESGAPPLAGNGAANRRRETVGGSDGGGGRGDWGGITARIETQTAEEVKSADDENGKREEGEAYNRHSSLWSSISNQVLNPNFFTLPVYANDFLKYSYPTLCSLC